MAAGEAIAPPKHKINWKRVIKRILHFGVDILDEFWPDENSISVEGGQSISIDYDELAKALVGRTEVSAASDSGPRHPSGAVTPPDASGVGDTGQPGPSHNRRKDGKAKTVPKVSGPQAQADSRPDY